MNQLRSSTPATTHHAAASAGDAAASLDDTLRLESAVTASAPPPESGAVARLYRDDHPPEDASLADLPGLVADDRNMVWIDLGHAALDDLGRLAGALDLDPNAIRAAHSSWHRPRMLVTGDRFFVSATVAHVEPRALRVRGAQLSLFVGPNYLLSVHRGRLPFKDGVMERADRSPDLVRLDSAYMLYIVLVEMLEHYDALSEHLDDEIETMEERAPGYRRSVPRRSPPAQALRLRRRTLGRPAPRALHRASPPRFPLRFG